MGKDKWFKNLTPELAWEQYVDDSVEMFVSNFRDDGIHDIGEMCRRYAKDLPKIFDYLFTQDQIELIGDLLTKYVTEYVEAKGGIEKLDLYTPEELDELDKKQIDDVLALIRSHTDGLGLLGPEKMKDLYWKHKILTDCKTTDELTLDDLRNKVFIVTGNGDKIARIDDYQTLSNIIVRHNDALDELITFLSKK